MTLTYKKKATVKCYVSFPPGRPNTATKMSGTVGLFLSWCCLVTALSSYFLTATAATALLTPREKLLAAQLRWWLQNKNEREPLGVQRRSQGGKGVDINDLIRRRFR